LLWITLRRLADVLLTLVPLLVAGIVTLELCAVLDLLLNFANIIALPLLLGVGVAGPRYVDDAFETILIARLALAFLPERPARSQGGTDGSNPLSSANESVLIVNPLCRGGRGRACAVSPFRRVLLQVQQSIGDRE